METQNATIHLSPPNVDHATVRSSTPSRTGEKKKKNRESDLPHSQPTSQRFAKKHRKWTRTLATFTIQQGKKKWKLQVPTKENSGVPVTVNL
jgi:hypothetical protein